MLQHPPALVKARELYEIGDYATAAKMAEVAQEEAHHSLDYETEAFAGWIAAFMYEQYSAFPSALSRYNDIISLSEQVSIADWDLERISLIIRTYADWVRCAVHIDDLAEIDLTELFAKGEALLAASGKTPLLLPEFLHSKAMALNAMFEWSRALTAAEEGLARKRIMPMTPGCSIAHHLVIYATSLAALNRRDDAGEVVRNGLATYASDTSLLAIRALLSLADHHFSAAADDYSHVIAIETDASARLGRALALKLLGGDFEEDLRTALWITRQGPEECLWAAGLLEDWSLLPSSLPNDQFTSQLVRYFRRELSLDELLRVADKARHHNRRAHRRMSAFAFAGLLAEVDRALPDARAFYEKAISENVYTQLPQIWAAARLRTLER